MSIVVALNPAGNPRRIGWYTFGLPGARGPLVYRDGKAVADTCASPCGDGVSGHAHEVSLPARRDDVLVVVRAGTARIHLSSPGWRARETSPLGLRSVEAETADATGMTTTTTTIEHFTGASAPGGRRGSAAWLLAPCERGGSGTLILAPSPVRPSDPSREVTCAPPGSAAYTVADSSVPRTTTWTVRGDVTGLTEGRTRLVVLDLP